MGRPGGGCDCGEVGMGQGGGCGCGSGRLGALLTSSAPSPGRARRRAGMLPPSRPREQPGGRRARPPRPSWRVLAERNQSVVPVGAWVESAPGEPQESPAFVSAAAGVPGTIRVCGSCQGCLQPPQIVPVNPVGAVRGENELYLCLKAARSAAPRKNRLFWWVLVGSEATAVST